MGGFKKVMELACPVPLKVHNQGAQQVPLASFQPLGMVLTSRIHFLLRNDGRRPLSHSFGATTAL
jgi:hypothetical protein